MDKNLKKLILIRKKIDKVDQKLLIALNQRAKLSIEIAQIKKKMNLKVKDLEREKQIISSLIKLNQGPLDKEFIEDLFKKILLSYRKWQQIQRK